MIKRIKIPEDRLAVIIGTYGKTRKFIEKKTNTKIAVPDEVEVSGESLDVMTAENIIKAVGRGFSPENAIELIDEENTLLLLDLPKGEKELKRIKSRLIGTKGKSRRNIEMLTVTKISIYGRTAGIIGKYDNVKLAEDAISRLIKGISHKSVYEYLEKKKIENAICDQEL
ncbi:RNA-processing protein [archaeon]|nr:RNA-processing protein [archaeon]